MVDRATTTTAIAIVRDGLEDAGAPVIGFIMDEPKPGWAASPWVRMLKRSGAAFLIIFLFYSAFTTAQLWNSWNGVARESLDTGAARAAGTPMPPPPQDLVEEEGNAGAPIEDVVMAELAPEGAYRSFLLIGSDEAAGIADVILLTVLPTDGSEPFIVSLPRDLYVPNRCTNDYTRINATLHGCGDINGPTALSLAVEDFTGIAVDHFALFDFDGFAGHRRRSGWRRDLCGKRSAGLASEAGHPRRLHHGRRSYHAGLGPVPASPGIRRRPMAHRDRGQ